MGNSIWEAFKEGHEKYNQQRRAKQKEAPKGARSVI